MPTFNTRLQEAAGATLHAILCGVFRLRRMFEAPPIPFKAPVMPEQTKEPPHEP